MTYGALVKRTAPLWILTGLFAAAACGLALYKAWPLLFPQAQFLGTAEPGCDLTKGPCSGRLPGGGRVRLSITPRPIPVVKPLAIEVDLEGIQADTVEVDFVGVNMNMGFNRPRLKPAGPGRFRGRGVLPVCVRRHMVWEARVLAHTPDGLAVVPFRFDTYKRR